MTSSEALANANRFLSDYRWASSTLMEQGSYIQVQLLSAILGELIGVQHEVKPDAPDGLAEALLKGPLGRSNA